MNQNQFKLNYLKTNYSHKKFSKPYDFKLIDYILKIIKIDKNLSKKVLDVGCGTASFKNVFESFDFSYNGIDIDNHDPLNGIINSDIGNKPFPYKENSYDLVFMKMIIEHLNLKEISNCLAECFRVLKPKGHLIVLTPSWKYNYDIFYDEYTHLTPFTPNSLKTVLKMNNFKIEYLENFIQIPFFWNVPSFAKIFAYLLSLMYSINKTNKLIKYSKERIILGIASK